MSNPTPSNLPVTWHITQQVQGLGRTPGGQYQQGVTVTFATDAGHEGQVFVLASDYTPDNVAAAVNAAARKMRDISSLSGTV